MMTFIGTNAQQQTCACVWDIKFNAWAYGRCFFCFWKTSGAQGGNTAKPTKTVKMQQIEAKPVRPRTQPAGAGPGDAWNQDVVYGR